MLEYLSEVKRKDTRRTLSQSDREEFYFISRRKCGICEQIVELKDLEIHHIIQHQYGGQTKFENLQLVHRWCHPKGNNLINIDTGITEVLQPWEEETPTRDKSIKTRKGGKRVSLEDLFGANLLTGDSNFMYNEHSAKFYPPDTLIYEINGKMME